MIYQNGETADNSEILNSILSIRGKKVLTDLHLAKFFNIDLSQIRGITKLHQNKFQLDHHLSLTHSEISFLISKNLLNKDLGDIDGEIHAYTIEGVEVLSHFINTDDAFERYTEIKHVFSLVNNMISSLEKLKDNLTNLKTKMAEMQSKLETGTSTNSRFSTTSGINKYSDRFQIDKNNY